MKAEQLLDRKAIQSYYVLDSRDKGDKTQQGNIHHEERYSRYVYKKGPKRGLIPGSAFLYRRPGSGKKFQIIGGGVIAKDTEPDHNGDTTAYITHGFEIEKPLQQGDVFLESFEWKFKQRGKNWQNFFVEYGITPITEEDFWGLLSEASCRPVISLNDYISDHYQDAELIVELENKGSFSDHEAFVKNSAPVEKSDPIEKNGKVYPRKRKVSLNALNNARHKCEINNEHESFIRRRTKLRYCEPHHLVPMAFQERYKYSLDVEENVVCLCSNCHNQIHYGEGAAKLVKQLYQQRRNDLGRMNIDIDLETLLSMYDL